MEQISPAEFKEMYPDGPPSYAEIQARKAQRRAGQPQSGRKELGVRRNRDFEPGSAQSARDPRPVLPEVSAQMAEQAGDGVVHLVSEPFRAGGPLAKERNRRALMNLLLQGGPESATPYARSRLEAATGVPFDRLSPEIAYRVGQFMDVLGLPAGQATGLALREATLAASGASEARTNAEIGELMRNRGRTGRADTIAEIQERTGEIRPQLIGDADAPLPIKLVDALLRKRDQLANSGLEGAALRDAMAQYARHPGVSAIIDSLDRFDPAWEAVREPLRQLTPEETKRLAYESGNQRRIGAGRRNPFLKEPFVQEQLPGGIPVLTGETSEQAQTKGSDGNYYPAYKAVIGPDGSITAEPVMQIPQSWPVRLDPAYETQLRGTLKQALYGNPTAPETQAARALLKELNANPQYAFDEGGRPRVTRAPDLRVASLNVINPTAYALSPEAVRTSLDTESKSEIGSYGGIANTVLPDVGQGEHGFRDIDDPFTERRFIEKQLTSGQYVRALKQDNLTPIRSYVISETSDLEPPVVWPRGVQDAVVGPKSAMPMVVEHDGQLWSVSQTPLGRGVNGEPLYQHQLARPVYPMPGDPVVNDEGRLVASFRVGTPGRDEPSMITTEGFRRIGDFLAQEAELQGLTQPGGPRLALMSNQPSSSPDPNTLDYRLLVDSGAINPAGSSYVVGEFPSERVTREVGASVDPRANHLYRQINAMAAQASLPGDPRLTTFDPAGSEDARHYMTQLAPRVQEKIDAMAAARKAVGLPGSGASNAAKAGRRGQPSVNAFATFDAGAPPELAAAASGDPGARPILAPDTLPPEVRRQLELNKLVNPASGAFNEHGMNWLRGHGRAYLQDAIEQSRPRPAAQSAGSGAWMEGESYPRVPSVPTPQGDAPVYSAGLPGARGLATSRPPGGAMPPLPEDVIPEVTYVPTDRGTYVITDEGTTRLSAPEGAAVVTGRALPSATDVLVGEQLAAYVQEARARIAQQNAAQQEARALRVEAARNRADRAGIVRSPRL